MKRRKKSGLAKKTQLTITKEELIHLTACWNANPVKDATAIKFKMRRINYLKMLLKKSAESSNAPSRDEFNLILSKPEIECLYIYWIKQSFYDSKESDASKRMIEFKSKVGGIADIIFAETTKELWQADIEHSATDMDDIDFPEEDFDLYRGR